MHKKWDKIWSLAFFSWFLLLQRYRIDTGLFWGAIDSIAGLFDVFYYIFLVKAPVKLSNLTFCAQCVVKCPNLVWAFPNLENKSDWTATGCGAVKLCGNHIQSALA